MSVGAKVRKPWSESTRRLERKYENLGAKVRNFNLKTLEQKYEKAGAKVRKPWSKSTRGLEQKYENLKKRKEKL